MNDMKTVSYPQDSSDHSWYSMRTGKYVVAVAVIIFIIGIVCISYKPTKPVSVIANSPSYPANTQIETYDQVPSEFPKNVLAEGGVLNHADIVRGADHNFTATVIYTVASPLPLAISGEQDILKKAGWQIESNKINANSGFISATKGTDSMVTTFTMKGAQTEVSFQFSSH